MERLLAKYRNIIIIILVAGILFYGYSVFFSDEVSPASLLSSQSGGERQQALVGREFLTTLLELRSLELDESLFSDQSFVILQDFSQEVAPQPTGRPNPFLLIGDDPILPVEDDSGGDGS